MGKIKSSQSVKLFVGLLYENGEILYYAQKKLLSVFKMKNIDMISNEMEFVFSDYYKNIGENLKRKWFSFSPLIPIDEFYLYKIISNEMENEISLYFGYTERKINIDPGYVTLSTVYLASTKYAYYRCYIGKGIYLEPEMFFYDNAFRFFDWTYPDYKTYKAVHFFWNIRELFKITVRKKKDG
jgi:hypothetical protein